MTKPILLSGAQPTGRFHIGNYLGALKNWVDLQNSKKYSCYFPIVDLHSLTAEFDPKEKQKQILELAADYIAAGLDPKKSVISLQSQIPAHTELMWILSAITPMGDLTRMTQFKDKMSVVKEIARKKLQKKEGLPKAGYPVGVTVTEDEVDRFANLGLFAYPTLMAADIILYDAKFVPVGNDQDQHLELTRSLVRKFNNRFGHTFVEPQGLHTKTPRIMSLKDPTKKMSKSQPETCLFLDDSPNEIEKKLKTAVTDSESVINYDVEKKPGISNLLDIYSGLSGQSIEKLEKQFSGKNYGEFKSKLIGVVIDHLAPFRKKKAALLKKPAELKKVLRHGSGQAAKVANKKIEAVKRAVGLLV